MRNEPDFLVGLGLPSGSWRCRWHQASRTELEELCLTFDKGSVQGSGMDADGLFEYLGSAYADGSLSLTKTYHLHHIPVPASMSWNRLRCSRSMPTNSSKISLAISLSVVLAMIS